MRAGFRRSALTLAPVVLALACGQSQRAPHAAAGAAPADGGAAGQGGAGNSGTCSSVEFADAKVDAAVRAALVNAPARGPLSAGDVAPLVRLNVEGAADLSGIECLSGLVDLTLYSPAAASLAPLARLPLKIFAAHDGRVTSAESLGSIVTLEQLRLAGVGITDVSFVSELTRLAALSVTDSALTSLDPLSALAGLQSVVLSDTRVGDLTPLAALQDLWTLSISNTQVSEVDAIPVPSGDVTRACLYAQNLPLSPHALNEGIPALCARGWAVSWSTADGAERGSCNGSCDK